MHAAALPAGFSEAGEALDRTGGHLGAVATSLSWESAMARSRQRELHGEVATRARVWADQVAQAGLIPDDQVEEWVAARDAVENTIVTMIRDAHDSILGNVTRYEGTISSALAGLVEQDFADPGPAGGVDPAAPEGDPVVLAGLGTPIQAGYAADPVNTAIGNFVESETDLEGSGPTAGLAWTRTYNSRAAATTGPLGPRWASWAGARLTAGPGGAHYTGPDGQQLAIPRDPGGGFARVPDLAARVVPADADADADTAGGLVLAWNDGRRWTFAADGRPSAIEHGPGTTVSFTHDDHGRLVRLVHAGGAEIVLTWAGTWITAVMHSDGRTVGYHYTDDGHLARADAPTGARRYAVDRDGLIASVTDADGVVELVNTYDDDGRVVGQLSPHGRRTVFAYRAEPVGGGSVTVVSDEGGGPVDTFRHDAAGRLVAVTDGAGATATRTYDTWGNPVRSTARDGAVTEQDFDEHGRPVRRMLPGGAQIRLSWDELHRPVAVTAVPSAPDEPRSETRFGYRGAERIPSEIVDPEGGVTRIEVHGGRVEAVTDADGVHTRLGYDAAGRVVAVTNGAGTSGEGTARIERDPAGLVSAAGRRVEFEHDRHGRVVARRDATGATWRYEYTAAGRASAVIDPLGSRTELRYGGHGDVADVLDPLGGVTARAYDPFGNVTGLVAPDGASWGYGFDALSRLTSITDPADGTWLRRYDVQGRLVGTVDPVGIQRSAAFDGSGLVSGVDDGLTSSAFGYDGLGRATAHARPDGATLSATYDRCGRRLTETGPDGGTVRFTWTPAGRLRTITSAEGRTETRTYDGGGRLVTVSDAAGAQWSLRHDLDGALVERSTPTGAWERFDRDGAGRVVRRKTSRGVVTTWAYDAAGRVTEVDSPLAGTRRFTHDAAGRVVAATDALGHTTGYGYDRGGRLVTVTDPLGAVTRYTHDAAGRVTAETDPLGRTTRYTYDAAGHLVARTDPTGATVRWELDASARVRSIAGDGAGERITVERDVLGRPVGLSEPGRPTDRLVHDIAGRLIGRRRDAASMTWSYDRDGRRTATGYPDGTHLTQVRDAAGRTARLRHPLLGTLALERDADGRLVAVAGIDPARTTHDHTGRISSAVARGRSARYGYDAGGQLTTAADRDGDRTYRYDACGRLVAETGPGGERTYAYDPAGQLRSAGDRRYRYDAAGRRTAETGPGHERRYHYDWLGRVTRIETRTADGPTRSTDLTVDALGELAAVDDTPVLWDTADPLRPVTWIGHHTVLSHDRRTLAVLDSTRPGTPSPASPAAGAVDPWGAAPPGLALDTRGEVTVDGLVWLRNRVYDPDTRAFLSPDPLSPVPGTPYAANPYHYAANDPVNRTDPLGLRPLTDADMQDDPGLFGAIGSWWDDNGEYVAAGGMAVLGAGLMFTGIGGVAGVALMGLSGTLLAGAGSTAIQRFENGAGGVDWNQVRGDAAIGGLTGIVGGAAGVGLSRIGGLAALPGGATTQAVAVGGLSSVPAGMVGRGLTGGDPLNPTAIAADLLIGGTAGGVTARLGGIPTAAPDSPTSAMATSDQVSTPLWTETKNRTSVENALAHFNKHGSDFPGVNNSLEYVAHAQEFLRNPPIGTWSMTRQNGDTVRYNADTDNFGVMNSQQIPRTFFMPDPTTHPHETNFGYFLDQ